MNFLSRVFSYAPSTEKSQNTISPGEFSIVRREDSPKGRRELIFKESELVLAKTTRDFCVQLQVRDLNSEKKTETDDDGFDMLDDEGDVSVLVHGEIELGYFLKNGRTVIAWRDLEGENGDRYEFLCAESVSRSALDRFDREVCESLYGQKYGKPAPKDAPEALFEEFSVKYDERPVVKLEPKTAEADNVEFDGTKEPSPGRVCDSRVCDLCIYDPVKRWFMSPKKFKQLDVFVIDQGNYDYFLEVRKEGKAVMGIPIDASFDPYLDMQEKSFIFNYEMPGKVIVTYLLRLNDLESLQKFDTAVTMAKYEAINQERWEDAPGEKRDFLIEAIEGLSLSSDDNEGAVNSDDEGSPEEEEVDVDAEYPESNPHERNSALEVGHANNRTFVVRGDKIGVFKNTDRNLEYSTTINSVGFDPKRILLHEQDSKLVLQSETDSETLYRMDLETGKIVDEWKTGAEVIDFNPVSKFAQTTAEQNLLGVSNQSLFRIDPRIEGGRVQKDQTKTYATKNMGLSTVTATKEGWIAVGSSKGELRLFDKLGRNAKTLISGIGDPILALDVSGDGKFVLATCKTSLLLFTTADDENNGFTKVWKVISRPKMRKLQISPENEAHMRRSTGEPISFTPAKFNTSPDSEETSIITSTGRYLVTWSLKSVLKGDKNAYRIKWYDSTITANNFQYGTDKRVILALEDDVNMVAKSALRRPDTLFKSLN